MDSKSKYFTPVVRMATGLLVANGTMGIIQMVPLPASSEPPQRRAHDLSSVTQSDSSRAIQLITGWMIIP